MNHHISRRASPRRPTPGLSVSVLLAGLLVVLADEPLGRAELVLEGGAATSCDTAESCFRSALASPPGTDPESATEPGSGNVERLRLVMERYPDSPWAKRATLLAGVWLKERDPARAVELLEDAEQYLPLLADYIRFWRAEALLALGEPTRAAALFESIPRTVPDTLLKASAAYRGGDAWYGEGDCPEAIVQLARAVTLDPGDEMAPRALLHLADCQLREIRNAEGQATLVRIWTDYPGTPEAGEALARLGARAEAGSWAPTPDMLLARAQVLLDQALYQDAAETLTTFLEQAPDHPERDEARYKLGLAYARLKRYGEVRPVFEELVDGKGDVAGKAAVWLSKVYVRSGHGRELLRLVDRLPELPLSPRQQASVFLSAGVWLEDKGRKDEALAMYQRMARAGSGTSLESKARWHIGWLEYQMGRLSEAAATFEAGAESGADFGWTPQFLYWMGRALSRIQDPRAEDVYRRLCTSYPLTYYGKLVTTCAQMSESGPAANGHGGAEAALDEPPEQLRTNRHYEKAVELLQVSLKKEAARELTWLARQGLRHRRVLLALSAKLSEAGAHHEALRLAKIYFRDYLEGGRRPAASGLWHVAYPTGYLSVINAATADAVDPFLVAALIREESLYDAKALSPAGAIGLMQLMPATARRLGDDTEDIAELRHRLFKSHINIRLGSRYLSTLVQRFEGNILHAVAAYNAGPRAVSTWVRRNGAKEPDEFVELIPYRETRGYVKRVLRSYREYHRLQRGTCAAPSLDKVC